MDIFFLVTEKMDIFQFSDLFLLAVLRGIFPWIEESTFVCIKMQKYISNGCILLWKYSQNIFFNYKAKKCSDISVTISVFNYKYLKNETVTLKLLTLNWKYDSLKANISRIFVFCKYFHRKERFYKVFPFKWNYLE